MDGTTIIMCDRIIAVLLLSTPCNKGDTLSIPYRNQSEGHRIFGLNFSVWDRRKARQNRLKTEERYAKLGIEEYQIGNQHQKQAATQSHRSTTPKAWILHNRQYIYFQTGEKEFACSRAPFEPKPCLKSRPFWRLESWQLSRVGLGLSTDLRDLQLLALVSYDLFRWLSKTSVISDKRIGPAMGQQGRSDCR